LAWGAALPLRGGIVTSNLIAQTYGPGRTATFYLVGGPVDSRVDKAIGVRLSKLSMTAVNLLRFAGESFQ